MKFVLRNVPIEGPGNKNCQACNLCQYLHSVGSVYYVIKGEGKATPLQAWTGPEGSRRLRLPDFKTIVI